MENVVLVRLKLVFRRSLLFDWTRLEPVGQTSRQSIEFSASIQPTSDLFRSVCTTFTLKQVFIPLTKRL